MSIAPERVRSVVVQAPARRVVLLGASNLTKGIGLVLAGAHRAWGEPLAVLAAIGHGRSYGRLSSVLGRQLPGILESGLWQDLGAPAEMPTAALVTDIGNDLLYEESVPRIVGWVEACLDRLAAAGSQTVVTPLPLANLHTLSQARYKLMRTLFFPRSRISLATVTERAHALDEHVRRLAAERGFKVVSQRTAWYGFDPVHIKLRHRSRAWQEILAPWNDSTERLAPARSAWAHGLYLASRVPHRRRVWGFEQRGRQPASRWRDGTHVSFY